MRAVKKYVAFMLALMMVITAVPLNIPAAAKPAFKKEYKSVYENASSKGEYVYTLKNLTKGQTVKWSVSGDGKKYVTLKFKDRKVTGKTSSNRIFINTEEDLAAKKAKFKLTAKIYSKKGKLESTVTTQAVIKILSTEVDIVGEALGLGVLPTGTECSFAAEIFPTNYTDTVKWTVTNQAGIDVSAYISQSGVFKTDVPGTYTITATTYNGSNKKQSDSQSVVVDDSITKVVQTNSNSFKASFSSDISKRFDRAKMSIVGSDGSTLIIKESKVASDGTVNVTTHANFTDGVVYTVKYANFSTTFKASVGVPAVLTILTEKVTVDKLTEIQYAILDKNGIDVTAVYPGTIEYTPKLTNGIIDENKMILMKTVGSSGTISAKFTPADTKLSAVEGSGTVVCIALTSGEKTNFTITDSPATPDYSAASYADQRNVYLGTTAYAHFRALDSEGDAIKYESITYTSSDPDALIINANGKVTPIKAQKVTIFVTAKANGLEYPYNFDVVVAEKPYLSSVSVDQSTVSVSNLNNADYQKYIHVTALDQFKSAYALTDEVVTFIKPTAAYAPTVTYDAENNRIAVNPSSSSQGTYTYQVTVTSGGKSAATSFTVVVSNVPTSGVVTYEVELDNSIVDVAVNAATTVADQYTNVRLAKYVNNIFAGYATFTVNSISKDGKYYGSDLTSGAANSVQQVNNVTKLALLTRKMTAVDTTTYNCTKAELGTYNIALTYYRSDISSNMTSSVAVTVTDTETAAAATVERTTSTETCVTALDLAKNCIAVKNGIMTDCVVTGEANPGSKVAIASKDQCHIKEIKVINSTTVANGITINEVNTIAIGKTLTNK